MTKPLNENQLRFVREYLIDRNGTQAAIRAGYSKKGASAQACTLLANPKIKEILKKEIEKTATNLGITRERVLAEMARLAFANTADLYDDKGRLKSVSDLPEDVARAVSEVSVCTDKSGETTIKLKLHSKDSALDKLARHLGLYAADNLKEHEVTIVDLTGRKNENKHNA